MLLNCCKEGVGKEGREEKEWLMRSAKKLEQTEHEERGDISQIKLGWELGIMLKLSQGKLRQTEGKEKRRWRRRQTTKERHSEE